MKIQFENNLEYQDRAISSNGDDLYEKSKGRDVYDGYIINDIYIKKVFEIDLESSAIDIPDSASFNATRYNLIFKLTDELKDDSSLLGGKSMKLLFIKQSNNLEILYYNTPNSTSQASLQCSPREVV